MTVEDNFINEVLANVPDGARRAQIELDLRAHLAERVEHGQSIEAAIRQFGDPAVLAESYLAAVPLVSASFVSRAAAKLIDVLVLAVAVGAVLWTAWQLLGPDGVAFIPGIARTKDPFVIATCVLTVVLLVPGYFIVAEYVTGETFGKRALGLRVVRESGARISLGQSFVRQLPLIASIFLLDVLFALFTEKNQRAFELISKTRVVVADT
jgi:uncharacterized RDD family membrane protein YckC